MKKVKFLVEFYTENQKVVLTDDILQMTISNNGNTQVMINESVMLEPGESISIPHIPGYSLTGEYDIKVTKREGDGYTDITRVSFRKMVAWN